MAEFVSTFITGFQNVVKEDVCHFLPGVKILNVFDGMIHYKFDGNSRLIEKIPYFNNTFFVLCSFVNQNTDFLKMISFLSCKKHFYLINKGSFRIRFSKENQFVKVDKNISNRAETIVLQNSRLNLDRLNPSTEIWYVIRREAFAFCGELLCKREFTEKNLNKGELRPEIAYLMCCFAGIKPQEWVLEPFAGYGSIPVQIAKHFSPARLFVSEIDENKVAALKEKKSLNKEFVELSVADALVLPAIQDKTITSIISDPPWGYFENIGNITEFYTRMFESFKRVTTSDAVITILSARTEEFETAVEKCEIKIIDRLSTLVNGKKASLYKCCFN